MAAVAPQLVEDLFGTKVFTINFTIRDSGNTTDRTDAGYLEVTANTNAVITGNTTNSLTIVGTQPECNTAMASLNYVPSADFTESVGVSYSQNDNQGTPEFTDFMLMSVRTTHDDVNVINNTVLYAQDNYTAINLSQITDLRSDNIDNDIIYNIEFSFDNPNGGIIVNAPFTGTKDKVNELLANVQYLPGPGLSENLTLTVTQTQVTDNITQGTFNVSLIFDEESRVEPFIVDTDIKWIEDTEIDMSTTIVNNDTRGEVIADIIYRCDIIVSDPNAGILDRSWLLPFVGTKAQTNDFLSQLSFTPSPDYADDFVITYTQRNETDGIELGSVDITMDNVENSSEYFGPNFSTTVTNAPRGVYRNYDWRENTDRRGSTMGVLYSVDLTSNDPGITFAEELSYNDPPSTGITKAFGIGSLDYASTGTARVAGASGVVENTAEQQKTVEVSHNGLFTISTSDFISDVCINAPELHPAGRIIVGVSLLTKCELYSGEFYSLLQTITHGDNGTGRIVSQTGSGELLMYGNEIYKYNVSNTSYDLYATLPVTQTGNSVGGKISADGRYVSFYDGEFLVRLFNSDPDNTSTWNEIGRTTGTTYHDLSPTQGYFVTNGGWIKYDDGVFARSGSFTDFYDKAPAINDNGTSVGLNTRTMTRTYIYIHDESQFRNRVRASANDSMSIAGFANSYVLFGDTYTYTGMLVNKFNTILSYKINEEIVTPGLSSISATNLTQDECNDLLETIAIKHDDGAVGQVTYVQTQITDNIVQATRTANFLRS